MTAARADEIDAVAATLLDAEDASQPVDPVSAAPSRIRPDEAYRVQLALAERRRLRGERPSGYKVGLTSTGMQTLLGVDEPDFGHLFAEMEVPRDGVLDRSALILPRAEPELAFILGSPLDGSSVTTADVVAATAEVATAIEVVDSRVRDWRITWTDTVADNGSSSRYVLGDRVALPSDGDVRGWMTRLHVNGRLEAEGTLAEVMGDPLAAVAWLARTLHGFGLTMRPGDVVLSGSPVKAVDLRVGDRVVASIDHVGDVAVAAE